MIYRAIQLIQIVLADERTNGQTDEGVPRGPRGPKKKLRPPSLRPFVYCANRNPIAYLTHATTLPLSIGNRLVT